MKLFVSILVLSHCALGFAAVRNLMAKEAVLTTGVLDELFATKTIGKPVQDEASDSEWVRTQITEVLPKFKVCYQEHLETIGSFEGAATLSFVLRDTGAVASVRFTEENLPNSLKHCLSRVLSESDFKGSPGRGDLVVSQPINFYPSRTR